MDESIVGSQEYQRSRVHTQMLEIAEALDAIRKRLDLLEAKRECAHKWEKGLSVQACKVLKNGIEVQAVQGVPFGAPVMAPTNLTWDVRICQECGVWEVILKKDKGLIAL